MFFSICIPVYNSSQYLKECIESVLSQTEKDYEIILVDDGSTDGSSDICDEYAKNNTNIRVIHKKNEGLMMTRRRGFREAQGKYVMCLDSDDYYCRNDVLEKIKNLIISQKCDLVMFNYIVGKQDKRNDKVAILWDLPDGYVFNSEDKKIVYESFLNGKWFNNIWNKVSLRENVDIDVDYSVWKEDICRAEDRFQSMPMLSNAERIGYLKEPMLYYRWTPSSISNNLNLKYYYAFRTIFKREDEYIEKWEMDENVITQRIQLRIETILGIIILGYYSLKENGNIIEWETFIKSISEDVFFVELIPQKYKREIPSYYRMIHFLIVSKRSMLLKLVLESYKFYKDKF